MNNCQVFKLIKKIHRSRHNNRSSLIALVNNANYHDELNGFIMRIWEDVLFSICQDKALISEQN